MFSLGVSLNESNDEQYELHHTTKGNECKDGIADDLHVGVLWLLMLQLQVVDDGQEESNC